MMRRYSLVVFSFIFCSSLFAQQQLTLQDAIALALDKNYDVRLARNTALIANTDNNYAIGGFLPSINGTANTLWNSNNQELRFEDATRNRKGTAESNNISASAQLNWTLFDGTRMFATRERIAIIAEQGELLVKNEMVNSVAAVVLNYYDIVQQKQQLIAIQEQMSVSEERVKLAERKLEVGIGAKPELLQARVDYNAQRTQALQQEALISQLKEQLNALVGMQLTSPFEVADSILIDLELNQNEIIETAENTSFSLLASKRNLDVAALQLRESRADLFPVLNFNAAYNYSKIDNTKLLNAFNPLFSKSNGYNYGFSVNIPVLNGLNRQRVIQQAQINTKRQQIFYEQQKANVDVGLRNAFVNYDNALKVLLIEEENILLAKENVTIALETFKRGATTFVELRTAQQSLADAYTRLISARYQAKVAEVEVLRLSGRLLR